MTHAEILQDYDDLEPEDLTAAFEFAIAMLKTKRLEPLAT